MSEVQADQGAAGARLSFKGEPEPEEAGVSMDDSHAIVVVGASGDLAKKKTYPALFKLFLNGLLPPAFKVWGYARSASDDDAFREKMRGWLEKYATKPEDAGRLDTFLASLVYHQGQYNSPGKALANPMRITVSLCRHHDCLCVDATRCRGFRQAQRGRDWVGG